MLQGPRSPQSVPLPLAPAKRNAQDTNQRPIWSGYIALTPLILLWIIHVYPLVGLILISDWALCLAIDLIAMVVLNHTNLQLYICYKSCRYYIIYSKWRGFQPEWTFADPEDTRDLPGNVEVEEFGTK